MLCGVVLKRAGLGRRTRQNNPAGSGGAKTLAQWLTAVQSMKGMSDAMPVEAAVSIIHATPADRRSQFAKEIWSLRRRRGTSSREVPF